MLHIADLIGTVCTFVYIAYEITFFVDTQASKKETFIYCTIHASF